RTVHTAARVGDARLSGPVRAVRADSGLLWPDRGRGWRALGDAAMACDPLAGNGVVRALRSAIAGAAEIDRVLDGEHMAAPDVQAELSAYLNRRASYYRSEFRWPNALFWARRSSPDWLRSPLTLPPTARLHWNGRQPDAAELASVESLLP